MEDDMLAGITKSGPDTFEIGGVRFRLVKENYNQYQTNEDEIVILKGPDWFNLYDKVMNDNNIDTVFELGIWEGGSAILFALLFPKIKFVALDFAKPKPTVLRWIERLGLSARVKLFFSTLQDDAPRVLKILQDEFGGSVGLVIDDASHQLAESKKSFEVIFPHVISGGVYIIEDWSWAHLGGIYQTDKWLERPALSNLVFDLTMLAASHPGFISSITVNSSLCRIDKGWQTLADPLSIDAMIVSRGKRLSII
jgi:hypothetical protein